MRPGRLLDPSDLLLFCSPFFDFHAKTLFGDIESTVYPAVAGFYRLCTVLELLNPLEVTEHNTYLLLIKRQGDMHRFEENKANRTEKPIANRILPGCTLSNAYEVGSCLFVPHENGR